MKNAKVFPSQQIHESDFHDIELILVGLFMTFRHGQVSGRAERINLI